MCRLHRPGLDGIERLQRGHNLARAEDADLEPVIGQFGDCFGKDLASAMDGIEAARVTAGQAPADRRRLGVADSRRRERRGRRDGDGATAEDGAAFHGQGAFRGHTEAAGTTEAGGGKGQIVALGRVALRGARDYGPPPNGSRSKAPVGDGQVAERSKARAWKVRIRQKRIVGSNPTLSAIFACGSTSWIGLARPACLPAAVGSNV